MLFFSRKKGIPKVGEIVKVSKSENRFHGFDDCFGKVVGYKGVYVVILAKYPPTGTEITQVVPREEISRVNILGKIKKRLRLM